RSGEVLNEFAKAAHAPQMVMRIDKRLIDALPTGVMGMAMKLPQLRDVRKAVLADFGIPDEVIEHVGLTAQFDTRDTERALKGSGIEVPELPAYAEKLWDYYERRLDPHLYEDRSFEGAVNGKAALIPGPPGGLGQAALDAWTKVAASEVVGEGITFTAIHMPLVRTPMIAPTKIYDAFPTITPEEAADMISEAIRAKPKHIGTRLGTFGEVAYALQPK